MSIRIENIKKAFGEKEVLKGINFEFEQGKINMIIGASGSGKSVMLKCIVGLLQPDEGNVWYGDKNFHESPHQVVREIRTQMGMLFQYSALFDSATIAENVGFPLQMFTKMSRREIRKRVAFCLERVNLSGVEKNFPSELSGGMQKRVGIARAIALNPKYLFVDEPNSGLDPLTASVIDQLIQELTEEYNMTTVVVSHDMNSVVNISDKIMFLHHGVKAWEGDKRSILRSGNETVDKFVFVSDLIRRDIYDEEDSPESSIPEPKDKTEDSVPSDHKPFLPKTGSTEPTTELTPPPLPEVIQKEAIPAPQDQEEKFQAEPAVESQQETEAVESAETVENIAPEEISTPAEPEETNSTQTEEVIADAEASEEKEVVSSEGDSDAESNKILPDSQNQEGKTVPEEGEEIENSPQEEGTETEDKSEQETKDKTESSSTPEPPKIILKPGKKKKGKKNKKNREE